MFLQYKAMPSLVGPALSGFHNLTCPFIHESDTRPAFLIEIFYIYGYIYVQYNLVTKSLLIPTSRL